MTIVTRLWVDAGGESHFEEIELPQEAIPFIENGPPIASTPTYATDGVQFLTIPNGWDAGAHPSPRRQFVAFLSGVTTMTASDGGQRIFRATDLLLLEDTFGQGHRTVFDAEQPVTMVIVALKEGEPVKTAS